MHYVEKHRVIYNMHYTDKFMSVSLNLRWEDTALCYSTGTCWWGFFFFTLFYIIVSTFFFTLFYILVFYIIVSTCWWGRGIGVARIFDWGGPKPQITRNDVIRNFRKSNFLWGKDIVEWKIWSRSLMALCQDFGKRRGRKLIVEKCKSLTWKTCWVS